MSNFIKFPPLPLLAHVGPMAVWAPLGCCYKDPCGWPLVGPLANPNDGTTPNGDVFPGADTITQLCEGCNLIPFHFMGWKIDQFDII